MRSIHNGKVWCIGLWVVLVGAIVARVVARRLLPPGISPTASVGPSAGLAKLDISDAIIDP